MPTPALSFPALLSQEQQDAAAGLDSPHCFTIDTLLGPLLSPLFSFPSLPFLHPLTVHSWSKMFLSVSGGFIYMYIFIYIKQGYWNN